MNLRCVNCNRPLQIIYTTCPSCDCAFAQLTNALPRPLSLLNDNQTELLVAFLKTQGNKSQIASILGMTSYSVTQGLNELISSIQEIIAELKGMQTYFRENQIQAPKISEVDILLQLLRQ